MATEEENLNSSQEEIAIEQFTTQTKGQVSKTTSTRSKKRITMHDEVEEENYNGPDKLSLLPDSLLHHILTLPSIDTKKAIQLSVLSKRWRYLWKSLPCIKITNYRSKSFTTFLDKVITLRDEEEDSAVHTFTLSCGLANLEGELVDKLASFLLKRNVQEVHIEDSIYLTDSIITSLASRVKILKLSSINMVEEEESDTNLSITSSSLEQFYLNSEHDFKSIIINAPRLKKLMINRDFEKDLEPGSEFRVCAPDLSFLHFQGSLFYDYILEDYSSLLDIRITIRVLDQLDEREEADRCLNKLFRLLVHAKSLTLEAYTFQVCGESPYYMWEAVRDNFPDLKFMKVYEWDTKNHIHTLAKFIERLSNLETLVLENIRKYDPTEYELLEEEEYNGRFWKQQLAFKCSYPKLKSVQIQFLKGDRNELIFIEFLLKSAPALENLSIQTIKSLWENELERLKFRNNLLHLPSYSSSVRLSLS